jgi:hypothetical protein
MDPNPTYQFPAAYERIEQSLLERGWTMLKWPSGIVYNSEGWYDDCHPKASVVAELISTLINDMIINNSKIKSILVIGDSTTAFCVDKARDRVRRLTLVNLIRSRLELTDIDVFIPSISGSSFTSFGWNWKTKMHDLNTSFIVQIERGTQGGYLFDAVLLIGGWNQKNILDDHIFDKFHQIALDALR